MTLEDTSEANKQKRLNLDEENNKRIGAIMSGQLGIQVNPMGYDLLRIHSYLEDLGEALGIHEAMKMNAAEKLSEILDQQDKMAAQMRLQAGSQLSPEQIRAMSGTITPLRK